MALRQLSISESASPLQTGIRVVIILTLLRKAREVYASQIVKFASVRFGYAYSKVT
jgi:hypothetical protein